jgi:hypothetical protein
VLIYTEYTDSQDALVAFLENALRQGDLDGEVLAVSGRPEHAQERSTITERFSHEDGLVLVSTDATAEGLNLHERCHHLIHLELPYNPNRLEQRNGRIDRYGQRCDPDVRYLYLAGTFEERLLLRLVAKYERQRARLTFVPNTLGGITTEDAQTVRLLEGLGEEEETLFATPGREIRQLEDAEEDDTGSAAYRDLLAEVERAMAGYEKAAKTSSWLGEVGLNAEARLLAEAEQARSEGERLGAVELMGFVCQALESDGGSVETEASRSGAGADVVLRLPPAWTHGLHDIPGYDAEQRTLHLTSDAKRCRDESGRDLGYLGRAHSIVRRALDRVRNLRFGEADTWLDRRVSAVGLNIPAPALLCTFLGVLESDRGHELERVLAVRIERSGSTAVLAEPEAWLSVLAHGEPIRTADLWDQHFKAWGEQARMQAQQAVAQAFEAMAEPAGKELAQQRQREQKDLEDWLRSRADTICGAVQQAQMDLLGGNAGLASWQMSEQPAERLAGFATDGNNPPAHRREADGVLRLWRSRQLELEQRAQLRSLEPPPLGLLMLVPTEGGQP